MPTDSALPHYESPPVTEVVCGIQFDPLPEFQSSHFGSFLQRVREEYPNTEDRPPLGEVREADQGTTGKGEIGLLDMPPLRRVFYVDPTGNFLLQLQPSRFLANWRKQREEDQYPRFSSSFRRFISGWTLFRQFVDEAKLGSVNANQYELSYINHIEEGGEAFPAGTEQFLPLFSWKSAQSELFLPKPSSARVHLTFTLPEAKGRLHVSLAHGLRPLDNKQILVMDLTARGPAKSDWSDLEDWFSLAHEWIVRGFTALTSTEAHKRWRRIK